MEEINKFQIANEKVAQSRSITHMCHVTFAFENVCFIANRC